LVSFPSTNHLGSKILGNFKLPKFDGNARYWKTWDKNFIRFLSIHQLDFVIEESFLNLLPLTPRNFEAKTIVYYILEDAVVTGSLAAKYLRQAAKWNGNEAYTKLHNGYVFSGPQTMALLLAELVKIRFKADESASGFCLRLREVFEELGDGARTFVHHYERHPEDRVPTLRYPPGEAASVRLCRPPT
jgi:hypothetical protein